MLDLVLPLLEMETQLILYSSKIRLNSLQNCQNLKSHCKSGGFLGILHKIYLNGIKKLGKTYLTRFFVRQLYQLVGQEMSFYYRK